MAMGRVAMQSDTRRILRNMRRVRRFPTNTCPASRHAALIAESLARSKDPDKEIDAARAGNGGGA